MMRIDPICCAPRPHIPSVMVTSPVPCFLFFSLVRLSFFVTQCDGYMHSMQLLGCCAWGLVVGGLLAHAIPSLHIFAWESSVHLVHVDSASRSTATVRVLFDASNCGSRLSHHPPCGALV